MKDTTPNQALDQLKQVEDKHQKALMVKALQLLKEQAKLVLKSKYATNEILKQLSISDTDQKAIIDWINSLSDVKLNDDDEFDIEEKVKDQLTKKKKEVEKDLQEHPNYFVTTAGCNGLSLTQPTMYTSSINCASVADTALNLNGTTFIN